ncbi:hypothetical protein RHSIM_Rhsim01G0279300 [Rhododendron simsii]|uniref:Rho-GAP domain-containing protein n=1 Tax=Rhododendron simsii TaxID=118357 RepID=A0A834HGR4_RHOSS|nr:hypothetical protein RHSIM_Rhsim01G0279300 [Rhododendron simsii]
MQCSYDSRGNSVPTILLLMQESLNSQEGLKAEGIFRINPENSKEEEVRKQLNRGIVPSNIDVHCLAGLIKAWFWELPSALLNWAIDVMADVVEQEEYNKMNARNIAMISDPLTALMHAVQVMNLLKTLIMRTLRDREEAATEGYSPMSSSYSSDPRTDGEIDDNQQDMDTSCEQLRGIDNAEDLLSVRENGSSSALSASDGEEPEAIIVAHGEKDDLKIPPNKWEDKSEEEMVDKIVDFAFPVPLVGVHLSVS